MVVVKSRFIRFCIFLLGVLSVSLGIAGVFLPVLPTTPFILLSAWCFLRSSEKAHAWIYRQPLFGKALKNWDEGQFIERRAKLLAIGIIALSVIFIWISASHLWIKYIVTALLLSVTVFITSRSER